jgi:2-aminobenzoate-CoA ligase
MGDETYTAHVDGFAREHLPPAEQWPRLQFLLPELQYPARMNCASLLIDAAVAEGHGNRIAVYSDAGATTFAELQEMSNRIANVLVQEFGVVPGNRVLLRGPNCTMLCAAWLAVITPYAMRGCCRTWRRPSSRPAACAKS